MIVELRKKKLKPKTVDKYIAKSILLQLYRDINDNKAGILEATTFTNIDNSYFEMTNRSYEELLGAIETLCVPRWLLYVRRACRDKNLI